MFADFVVPTPNWSAFGAFLFHAIIVLGILGGALFCLALMAAVVVLIVRAVKGDGKGASGVVQTVESEVKTLAASPAAKPLVHDAEALAAKVAEATIARLQNAPPVKIPDHPAATAVLDLIQESKATKQALADVAAAVKAADAVASGASTPKA